MWVPSDLLPRRLANARHATHIDCTRGEAGQTSWYAVVGFAPITLGRLGEGGLLQQFGGPLATLNLVKVG